METFVGFFIMFAICTGIFGYATLKDGSDQGRKECVFVVGFILCYYIIKKTPLQFILQGDCLSFCYFFYYSLVFLRLPSGSFRGSSLR